jgi:diguanylate cyclase (GGDEF)-like protein
MDDPPPTRCSGNRKRGTMVHSCAESKHPENKGKRRLSFTAYGLFGWRLGQVGPMISVARLISTRFGAVRALLRHTNSIPVIIALSVILAAGLYADHQNGVVFEQGLRSQVLDRMSLIRASLEGRINSNLQLIRGLVSVISSHPEMGEAQLAGLTATLLENSSEIRNVAIAPNLVVSSVFPLAGNERAIGLDYRTNDAQRASVFEARDTGHLVLAGPVALVQGGQGFIGRFPVFVERWQGRTFWGIVSAVIDVESLYQHTGLLDENLPIDVALTGPGPHGEKNSRFFGNPAVLESSPVIVDVVLPSGRWQIAAMPKGGWTQSPDNAWMLRLAILIGAVLVMLPLLVSRQLVRERQRYFSDIKSRKEELQRLSRRLELALDTSKIGVWEFDIETDHLVWDDRMNELYGLPTDGGARNYTHWRQALHPDDLARAEADFARALQTRGRYHSEYRVVTPSGETRHIRAIGAVYHDPVGTAKIVGVNWDVSADWARSAEIHRAKTLAEARNVELEATRARIEHNALHDSLTGLPNRRFLDGLLDRDERGGDIPGIAALLHIDLDRFKQINDTLGHAAGDAMLIHASKVLKANIGPTDIVARIGGDEFVIICTLETSDSALAELAERIIVQMRQPVSYLNHECRFGVSVGIASEHSPDHDPKRLLINADIALYRAKSRGRNRFEFFSEDLQSEVVSTKRIADEILSGLEQDEFTPYYQLQFNAHTHAVVGAEALARWLHPIDGVLAPDAFLRIAEELNVVSSIDKLILEKALKDRQGWAERGLVIPRISVNVSSRRLHDETLINNLSALDIPRGTVAFELVESIYLDESDEIVAWNIDQIKDLGIDIEIDDFGTGHTSIVSLLKLKPCRLKIDRQLVMPILASDAQRQLVRSIIEIGRSLGIEVVAEGVETLEHAHLLRDLGCDVLQGYAFGRPMSAAQVELFLRDTLAQAAQAHTA